MTTRDFRKPPIYNNNYFAPPLLNKGFRQNMDSAEMDKKSKKRFVWPDDLHREFISAVFDVGLSYATFEVLEEMLPPKTKPTQDQVNSQIAKLRMFRCQTQTFVTSQASVQPSITSSTDGYNNNSTAVTTTKNTSNKSKSEYASDVPSYISSPSLRSHDDHIFPHQLSELEVNVSPMPVDPQRLMETTQKIQQEVRNMHNKILSQYEQMNSLKLSLQQQIKVYNQLFHKLIQIEPSMSSEFYPFHEYIDIHFHSTPPPPMINTSGNTDNYSVSGTTTATATNSSTYYPPSYKSNLSSHTHTHTHIPPILHTQNQSHLSYHQPYPNSQLLHHPSQYNNSNNNNNNPHNYDPNTSITGSTSGSNNHHPSHPSTMINTHELYNMSMSTDHIIDENILAHLGSSNLPQSQSQSQQQQQLQQLQQPPPNHFQTHHMYSNSHHQNNNIGNTGSSTITSSSGSSSSFALGHDVRTELQAMSSEMRSHMNMHRQLLQRRDGQIQLHGSKDNSHLYSRTTPSTTYPNTMHSTNTNSNNNNTNYPDYNMSHSSTTSNNNSNNSTTQKYPYSENTSTPYDPNMTNTRKTRLTTTTSSSGGNTSSKTSNILNSTPKSPRGISTASGQVFNAILLSNRQNQFKSNTNSSSNSSSSSKPQLYRTTSKTSDTNDNRNTENDTNMNTQITQMNDNYITGDTILQRSPLHTSITPSSRTTTTTTTTTHHMIFPPESSQNSIRSEPSRPIENNEIIQRSYSDDPAERHTQIPDTDVYINNEHEFVRRNSNHTHYSNNDNNTENRDNYHENRDNYHEQSPPPHHTLSDPMQLQTESTDEQYIPQPYENQDNYIQENTYQDDNVSHTTHTQMIQYDPAADPNEHSHMTIHPPIHPPYTHIHPYTNPHHTHTHPPPPLNTSHLSHSSHYKGTPPLDSEQEVHSTRSHSVFDIDDELFSFLIEPMPPQHPNSAYNSSPGNTSGHFPPSYS